LSNNRGHEAKNYFPGDPKFKTEKGVWREDYSIGVAAPPPKPGFYESKIGMHYRDSDGS
jgi:hypothetical protein